MRLLLCKLDYSAVSTGNKALAAPCFRFKEIYSEKSTYNVVHGIDRCHTHELPHPQLSLENLLPILELLNHSKSHSWIPIQINNERPNSLQFVCLEKNHLYFIKQDVFTLSRFSLCAGWNSDIGNQTLNLEYINKYVTIGPLPMNQFLCL